MTRVSKRWKVSQLMILQFSGHHDILDNHVNIDWMLINLLPQKITNRLIICTNVPHNLSQYDGKETSLESFFTLCPDKCGQCFLDANFTKILTLPQKVGRTSHPIVQNAFVMAFWKRNGCMPATKRSYSLKR